MTAPYARYVDDPQWGRFLFRKIMSVLSAGLTDKSLGSAG